MEVVVEFLMIEVVKLCVGQLVYIECWGGLGELWGWVCLVELGVFIKVLVLGVEEQWVCVLIDLISFVEQWWVLGDGYCVGVCIVVQVQLCVLQVLLVVVFLCSDVVGMVVFVVEGGWV